MLAQRRFTGTLPRSALSRQPRRNHRKVKQLQPYAAATPEVAGWGKRGSDRLIVSCVATVSTYDSIVPEAVTVPDPLWSAAATAQLMRVSEVAVLVDTSSRSSSAYDLEHAEGPIWDAPTARLWWVDITGERVHCSIRSPALPGPGRRWSTGRVVLDSSASRW